MKRMCDSHIIPLGYRGFLSCPEVEVFLDRQRVGHGKLGCIPVHIRLPKVMYPLEVVGG